MGERATCLRELGMSSGGPAQHDLRPTYEVRRTFRQKAQGDPDLKAIDEEERFWVFWTHWTEATTKSDGMQSVRTLLGQYSTDIARYSEWMRKVRRVVLNP